MKSTTALDSPQGARQRIKKGKKRNLAKMQGSKDGKLGGARDGKEQRTALMKSKNDADQSRSVQDGKS